MPNSYASNRLVVPAGGDSVDFDPDPEISVTQKGTFDGTLLNGELPTVLALDDESPRSNRSTPSNAEENIARQSCGSNWSTRTSTVSRKSVQFANRQSELEIAAASTMTTPCDTVSNSRPLPDLQADVGPRKSSLRKTRSNEDTGASPPSTHRSAGDSPKPPIINADGDGYGIDRAVSVIMDDLEQQLSHGFLSNAQHIASLRYQVHQLMAENLRLRQEVVRYSSDGSTCGDELQVPDASLELHGNLRQKDKVPQLYASSGLTAQAASLAYVMHQQQKGNTYRSQAEFPDVWEGSSSSGSPTNGSRRSEMYSNQKFLLATPTKGSRRSVDYDLRPHRQSLEHGSQGRRRSVDYSANEELEKAERSTRRRRTVRQSRHASSDALKEKTEDEPERGFELLPFWEWASEKAHILGSKSTSRNVSAVRTVLPGFSSMRSAYTTRDLGAIVSNPMSRNRIFWESVGTVCIIYDLVWIPLQAFDFDPAAWRMVATWFTVMYWTCDIPCSFFVAYYHRGILQSRFYKTARHYVRTWFLLDVIIVSFDWIVLIYETQDSTSAGDLKYVKAGRSLRMLRFLRLVRLLRLHTFISKMTEQINSEYLLTILHVTKLIVLIVVVNHFVACGWYGLGSVLTTTPTWVDVFTQLDAIGYRYTTSLHWSLTQFTPASMEVSPTNTPERTYTVFVVICAMVLFSSFVSAITEAMTHLRKINSARSAQYSTLRGFLGDRQVSMPIAMRIWRYLEQCVQAKQSRKMFQDVELLQELPEGLQMDLLSEVYQPVLTRHPFFHQYAEANPAGMRALCHQACHESTMFAGQELFDSGQAAHRMYFLVDGRLDYYLDPLSPDDPLRREEVSVGMWTCELALWVHWFHRGTMVAKTACVILNMDVAKAHQVMKLYVDLLEPSWKYAELTLENLKLHGPFGMDLYMDHDKLQDMSQRAFDPDDKGTIRSQASLRSSTSRPSFTMSQSSSFWPVAKASLALLMNRRSRSMSDPTRRSSSLGLEAKSEDKGTSSDTVSAKGSTEIAATSSAPQVVSAKGSS